jgi:hypothetical protein
MRQLIPSPVRAQSRRTSKAILGLMMGLLLLTLACEEAQALNALAGSGENGIRVNSSPEALLLQQALQQTDALQSFRANVDMDMKMQGQELPLSFEMSKAANGRMRLVMEMDSLAAGMRIEMILAGDEMFANMPGAGWMRLDASALSGMLGPAGSGIDDPLGMFDSLFPTGDLPLDLYNVQSLGPDEVDGVPTEHLVVLMDFSKVLDVVGQGNDAHFSQLMALSGEPVPDGLGDLAINEIEVWIDEEGYMRRILMAIAMSSDSAVNFDMTMFAFNENITVDLPTSFSDISLGN